MAGSSLEFRVLGPLEVRRGARLIAPAGARRRSLLAMLLLDAGRVVSVARLVDGIWGPQPPRSAHGLVQTYVSLWRRVLEEGSTPDEPERLLRAGPGYRLVVRPGELDVAVVRDLADRGRTALAAGDHVRAADLLGDAWGRWRGDAAEDLAQEPFHAHAVRPLHDLRRTILLDWSAALVGCGRGHEAVQPLATALDDDPLQEELAEMLARTLSHVGRGAEALDVLDSTRAALADTLGVDPGERLRQLHLQVLRQDASLVAPAEGRGGTALPRPDDTFVGRAAAMADLARLLHSHRLVTLTGPGGAGKTRLAVELAADQRDSFGGDVHFVDASPITEAEELPARIVSGLGTRVPGGQTAWQVLVSSTADRPQLMIIDNCEQIAGAADLVTRLLASVPQVRLLLTSREPLRVRGEQRYPLGGLDSHAPDRHGSEEAGAATYSPAVRLFVDRAAAVDPGLTFGDRELDDIAELGRRLDGLPLAIELAAGWAGMLPPGRLLIALNDSMDVLDVADDGRPARQRTLRATLDWSYSLLDEAEQTVLRRLSVCRGGFTARGAAAVTGESSSRLLLALRSLHDKGLLDLDLRGASEGQRYRLLTTVREYAGERLAARQEQQEALARHAEFFVAMAEAEGRRLGGTGQSAAADRLAADGDDVAGALRWMAAHADPDRALEVAASLWRSWHLRAQLDEGRRLVEEVVDLAGPGAGTRARAQADLCLGNLAYWQTHYQQALEHYTRAAGSFRALEDRPGVAEATYDRGFALHLVGRPEEGQASFGDARERYRGLGDVVGEANAEAGLAFGLCNLGRIDDASEVAERSLGVLREKADSFSVANTVGLLGMIRRAQGDLERAEPLFREALTIHAAADHATGVVWMLRGFASLALARDQPRQAVRLAAAADVLDPEQMGNVVIGVTEPDILAEAMRLLPAPEVRRLWEAGRATSMEEAVREALS